jgi:hypothetical protein
MRYYLVENVAQPLPFVVDDTELYEDDLIIDGPFYDFISALDALDDLWIGYAMDDDWFWW